MTTHCDLECDRICKIFGSFVAVDGVSFEVPGGSFFSILGPSGSGKTTLLRIIAGFERPDSGDICIKQHSVLATPPNKRNIKMVFQHLALFPMMNVADNIAYGLRCRGTDNNEIKRRVTDALKRIGLPDAAQKEIHQLSGGQKQRIAIARCMVLEPDLLLLDEPLGALDLKLREHMKVELKLLQHQFDTTFVYVTHDQSEALAMSDYVAVMNHGRFEQIGSPQDLYNQPQTAFVARFIGDSNHWRGRVVSCEHEQITLKTENGLSLSGIATGDLTALRIDAEVEFFIRPEFISVRKSGDSEIIPSDGTMHGMNGTVENLLFNGVNSRVLVQSDGGMLEVNLPNAADFSHFQRGDTVYLQWAHKHGKCFVV